MDWATLIGGLGLGSLVTSLATHYFTRRTALSERWYQEKREAYLGLFGALHNAAVHPSDENAKAFALWQTRCDLFGSATVSRHVQELIDTNEGPRENRNRAFQGLIDAMRADLRAR